MLYLCSPFRCAACRRNARSFDRELEFFSAGKTKRARLPEGVNFELTTLAPKGAPSSWKHDAFPRGGHDIIHTYASDRYAMLIRYRGKAMIENALFRRVNRNLRVVDGQWDLTPPQCQLRKGLKPGAIERPLKVSVVKEISEAVRQAHAYLNLNPAEASANPETVQRFICDAVDKLIAAKHRVSGKVRQDLAIGLGCLWGQTLCDALGWQWRSLKYRRNPAVYAVVSPDRSCAVAPLHYMSRQITQQSASADNTTLLLFNMIKENAIGQPRPRGYRMLG